MHECQFADVPSMCGRYDGMVGYVPASLLVKKLGKKIPRKTCVILRSVRQEVNFF